MHLTFLYGVCLPALVPPRRIVGLVYFLPCNLVLCRVPRFACRAVFVLSQVRLAGHWVPKSVHATIEPDCK